MASRSSARSSWGFSRASTELFPISSLGHTVILPNLFGWKQIVAYQSSGVENSWLAFIVMLHVGSAVGLLIYFWKDWVQIVKAFFATLRKRRAETAMERLAWLIICASIPVGIIGVAFEHTLRTATAKPEIAIDLSRRQRVDPARRRTVAQAGRGPRARAARGDEGGWRAPARDTRLQEAGVIGAAQSTALIAGISRDGVVMATGLARGLDNEDAARYSFLLATPIILAAGLYKLPDLTGPNGDGVRGPALIAAIAAAFAAVLTVHFLMRYFKRGNLIPFGIYCVVFGILMMIYNF